MDFPPKIFLFNEMAETLFPMVNPREQSLTIGPQDPYTQGPDTRFSHTLFCGIKNAFAIPAIELLFPKDAYGYWLDQGTFSLAIDGEWVAAKDRLRKYVEGKPVPFPFPFTWKNGLFKMVPFSVSPKDPETFTGLFLTNGTRLDVVLSGLPEGVKVGTVLRMALYEAGEAPSQRVRGPREWSPRMSYYLK